MKQNKIILICGMCFFSILAKAQDNCIIYDKILCYINHLENSNKVIYITPVNGNDPENPSQIKEKDKRQRAIFFHIVKTKGDFKPTAMNWFSKLMNDSSLITKDYFKIEDTITQCNFKSYHRFIDFKDILSFSEKDYFYEQKGKNKIHYTPAKISFSEILYSEEIALVTAKVKIGAGGGDGDMYSFILKKKRENWEVQKCEIEVR